MTDDGETFLGRWSRLKRREQATNPDDSAPGAVAQPASTPVVEPERTVELPDLADLTKDSDYTVFMRPEVADDLRQDALRKLWRSDPVFAEHDGLTDYADDYRQQPGALVRTAYRVGRGYLEEAVDAEPVVAQDEQAAGGAGAAGEDDSTQVGEVRPASTAPDAAG